MNDSIIKTLSVAFAVCLVCSLFVSFAAVNLRETQNLNKINDQRVKVLQAAGISVSYTHLTLPTTPYV